MECRIYTELLAQFGAQAEKAVGLLKSMANETRLLILCQLSQSEMSVGELAKELPLSQSALSQHLALLRREKLVRTRRESQFVWYSLDSEAAQACRQLAQMLPRYRITLAAGDPEWQAWPIPKPKDGLRINLAPL